MHEDKTQVITFAEASSSSAGVFNLLFFLKKKNANNITQVQKKYRRVQVQKCPCIYDYEDNHCNYLLFEIKQKTGHMLREAIDSQ